MPLSAVGLRRSLLTGAGLVAGVAVVIGVMVIPLVTVDTYPGAMPQRAVPGFVVHIALDFIVAIALALIALKAPFASQIRRGVRRLGLGALACLTLLLAIALLDAASAFFAHGAAMVMGSVVLLLCSGAEVVAGVLSGRAAFMLPAAAI